MSSPIEPFDSVGLLAITKLAHGFGLQSVAWQVETDAIRARAAPLDADFGQGFFVGRLLELDEAIRDLPLYSCFDTLTAG
jgi:EAL domain-containing protein (putative c-di-GMP-specific phosphodiesterase class I)